jgi:hypothetical protein
MTTPPLRTSANRIAIVALGSGILAATISALTPSFFTAMIFAFIPAVVAVALGITGIVIATRAGGRRRAHAIWAVVLGCTPLLVWVGVGFVFAAFGMYRTL